MKILLTAFEPFGKDEKNAAQEVMALVRDEIAGAKIVKRTLPVVFGKSVGTALSFILREKPDAVLSLGQAGGRAELTPERIAMNLDDARIPDNEGNQPADQPIAPDGPAAYFSTLPVKAMADAILRAGVPASVSNSAGTYVCNHLMYGVLHALVRSRSKVRAGFLHIPYLHEQTLSRPGVPSLSREDAVRGVEAALRAIVENLSC